MNLDLFSDEFPHGTRAGFEQGCKSNGGCLNKGTGLQTCVQANQRLKSDWEYQKLVKAGMSELDAAAELAAPSAPFRPGSEIPVQPVFATPLPVEPSERPRPHQAFSAAQEAATGAERPKRSRPVSSAKRDSKDAQREWQRDYARRKRQELLDLRAENARLRAELAALRG